MNLPFQLIPNREDIETIYGFGVLLNGHDGKLDPKDTDISFAGWMTLDDPDAPQS